jgi:hypothetical protein
MADTGNDDFRDLYLADFIEANKRVARRRLECLRLQEPQTELLGRGFSLPSIEKNART